MRTTRSASARRLVVAAASLALASWQMPSALAVNPDVRITLEVPPMGSVGDVVGHVTGLPGDPRGYKAILLINAQCNIWWDKMYRNMPNQGQAQGAGAPLQADGTFRVSGWDTSPFDATSPLFAAFVMPNAFDLTWPQYVLENYFIHDYVWSAAMNWVFVDRRGCDGGPASVCDKAFTYVPLQPTPHPAVAPDAPAVCDAPPGPPPADGAPAQPPPPAPVQPPPEPVQPPPAPAPEPAPAPAPEPAPAPVPAPEPVPVPQPVPEPQQPVPAPVDPAPGQPKEDGGATAPPNQPAGGDGSAISTPQPKPTATPASNLRGTPQPVADNTLVASSAIAMMASPALSLLCALVVTTLII